MSIFSTGGNLGVATGPLVITPLVLKFAAAFVGGTLAPVGGHNLLEPAAFGVPVLFGPYTGHTRQSAGRLLDFGGQARTACPA